MKRSVYFVNNGFFKYVQCGSRIEKRESDNPFTSTFYSEEEAREAYEKTDPLADWRIEVNCSNGIRHYDGGFRSIEEFVEEWDEGEEELAELEFVGVLEYETFEEEGEEDE